MAGPNLKLDISRSRLNSRHLEQRVNRHSTSWLLQTGSSTHCISLNTQSSPVLTLS